MENGFGLAKCLCEKCGCQDVCEYYNDTVKKIVDAVKSPLNTDEFTIQIREILEKFRCDYFEE